MGLSCLKPKHFQQGFVNYMDGPTLGTNESVLRAKSTDSSPSATLDLPI